MTWHANGRELSVLAVIPARGGSKGVLRKNMRTVGGVSLVGRAAHLAASLPWIDHTVISTEDAEIRAEAVCHGASAPFVRPPELAGDEVSSEDVWRHAWLAAEDHYAMKFDISLLLEPTSPLRIEDDLTATAAILSEGGHASAATVCRSPAETTVHRLLPISVGVALSFVRPLPS